MYNINQTAQALALSAITIRRMIYDGRINAVKVGKSWRISKQEIYRIKTKGTK